MGNGNKRRNAKYGNVRKGAAPDLGPTVYASGWERDIARFLNLLVTRGVIDGWEYEPATFTFQGLGYKRGPFTYRPDFVLRWTNTTKKKISQLLPECGLHPIPGEVAYLEVKGQERGSDRSKWRRFRKHIGYPLDIVKRDEMKVIQDLFSSQIPNWESRVR
jgi:hypothetical protein